jgi:LCP family protein required for cell wall assembly
MQPAPSPGSATGDPRAQLGRIRFRRAVALMLMTLLVPGSAQLAAGRREVGRLAMRVWMGLIGTAVALFLVGLVFDSFVFWFLANEAVLGIVRLVLMGVAVGWAFLFIDAWRLGDPLALRQKQRLAMVGINGVLCFSVAGTLLFGAHIVNVNKDLLASMFTDGPVSGPVDGRFNILLLGGDSGADRWGLRPDSITVASIDADTGRTVLFGLPRNMLDFPFAKGSIMAEQFPDGYDCGSACELNSLATWAADHKALFKGVANPGVEATKEAVEGITGLDINYFAMVNLAGFTKMVDAVGGVRLNVRDRIPIGGVGGPVTGYIEPGVKKLDGYQTLWFARSRESADDYSRMARQKCVMNAMLHQRSPQKGVLNFAQIADASKALVTTDIPGSEVDRFMQLALEARKYPMTTVSFVPPVINTGDPDIDKIHQMVDRAIGRTPGDTAGHTSGDQAAGPAKTAKKRTPPPADAPTTGGAIGSLAKGYAANQADDLGAVC